MEVLISMSLVKTYSCFVCLFFGGGGCFTHSKTRYTGHSVTIGRK